MPNNIAILDLKFNFYSMSRKEQLVPFSLPWVYSSIRLLILVHQTTYKYQNCEYCHWKIHLQIMNHLSIEIYLNLIFYLLTINIPQENTNHVQNQYQLLIAQENVVQSLDLTMILTNIKVNQLILLQAWIKYKLK